jgi:outer membrane protein assembly factor BamD (BamD/ComL family)
MNPSTTLDLIDAAVAAAKRAAHACHNPQAREHFEYALALIGESWIAEDGQQARSAAQVITDVRSALHLFAVICAKPSSPITDNQ